MSWFGRRRDDDARQRAEHKADRADLALRRLETVKRDLLSSAERLAGILAEDQGSNDGGSAHP